MGSACGRDDPETSFRECDVGVRRHDPEVAGKGELEAAAKCA